MLLNNIMSFRVRVFSAIASMAVLLSTLVLSKGVCLVRADEAVADNQVSSDSQQQEMPNYSAFLQEHQITPRPQLDEKITVQAGNFADIHPEGGYRVLELYQGKANVLLVQSSLEYVEYTFDIEREGLYHISLTHLPVNEASRYELSLEINGSAQFSQVRGLSIKNTYEPESDEVIKNKYGDEFASNRRLKKAWTASCLENPDHNYDEPLLFYFKQGKNHIRLNFTKPETFVLGEISIVSQYTPPSYEEYIKSGTVAEGREFIFIEAEDSTAHSDSNLCPGNDHTDRLTSPYSAKNLLINIIGSSWNFHGQWLEWQVEVGKSGYYHLTFRYQQEALKGMPVARRLSIDGVVPFQEAQAISFPYTDKWDIYTVSNKEGEPYLFYLEKGTHTIRLQAVLGDLAPIIRKLGDIVSSLNQIYRQIIMITSTSPDKYRDYNLHHEIPGLIESLQHNADELQACYDSLIKISKSSSADFSIIQTLIRQLNSFVQKPRSIPNRISSFQSNIGSLSALVLDMRNQTLMLDYFYFWQTGCTLPKARSTFIDKIWHSFSQFFYSFLMDYNDLAGSEEKGHISIWLGTGRDQAQVIWRAIADLFTPKTGITVDVKLVSASMVEAFLSGNAPDVSIHVTRETLVNMAIRSALLELSSFEGFSDVIKEFHPEALKPYTYQNKVHGLPDTQTFNMLFYRRDILNELDIPVPQTWEEFIDAANKLQLRKLKAGIPITGDTASSCSMFYTLLMQYGGSLFNEDYSRVALNTPEALRAFSMWTDLYVKVGLPVQYDFFNRFRSGEMPLAVTEYTAYNQLMSAAPELSGLWEIAPIPGVGQADGTINRAQPANGTAAVILSSTTNPQAAWKFLEWWVGKNAQTRYAKDMESRIGVIARVPVANMSAFESMEWPFKHRAALITAWKDVIEIPQVPGNYYIDRDLTNAFRDVIYNQRNSREALLEYGKRINGELKRKREEFGLE